MFAPGSAVHAAWNAIHQPFPSQRAGQATQHREVILFQTMDRVGNLQVCRMQLPEWNVSQGHVGRPFPYAREGTTSSVEASSHHLSSRSHQNGRQLKCQGKTEPDIMLTSLHWKTNIIKVLEGSAFHDLWGKKRFWMKRLNVSTSAPLWCDYLSHR